MPFASYPLPPHDAELDRVASVLDPVLRPLGFAGGQIGTSERHGQVIFCRGHIDSDDDACVDLVVDLEANPEWRITDVRYWGYPAERWHLPFPRNQDLGTQLVALSRSLPGEFA